MRDHWLLLPSVLLFACLSLPVLANESSVALHEIPEKPPAPDFSLPDIDGLEHRLSGYRGQVVIVNFWATWCPPCREEMPSMQRAWPLFKEKDIELLAINVGEDSDTVFEFTANYPVEFPLLLDADSAVIQAWPVRGLPTTFVIDPQGRIVYRAIGARDWDDPRVITAIEGLKAGSN